MMALDGNTMRYNITAAFKILGRKLGAPDDSGNKRIAFGVRLLMNLDKIVHDIER